MSTSSAIAGTCSGAAERFFSPAAHVDLHDSVSCKVLKVVFRDVAFPEHRASAAQLVQIVVHHTADGEGADLMACVLHGPTNEVDVAATNAQQSQFWLYDVSLYGFLTARQHSLLCRALS